MSENGITRREFDRALDAIEELERQINQIDRDGSAGLRRLTVDVNELRGTVNWIIRGFIAGIGLALIVYVLIQGGAS